MTTYFLAAAIRAHLVDVHDRLGEQPTSDEKLLLADAYLGLMS